MPSPLPGCFPRPASSPHSHLPCCPKCPGHPSLSAKEKRDFEKKEKAALEKQRQQLEAYYKKYPPSQAVEYAAHANALALQQQAQAASEWPKTEADWLVYAKLLQAHKAGGPPPSAPISAAQTEEERRAMQAWQTYASVLSQQAQREWEKHLASQKAAAEAASAASAAVWAKRAQAAEEAEKKRELETQRWIALTLAKEERMKREAAERAAKAAKEQAIKEAKEAKARSAREKKEAREKAARAKKEEKEKAAKEKRERKERERREREIDRIWKGASRGKLRGGPA